MIQIGINIAVKGLAIISSLFNFRVTENGDNRITEDGDKRITE
jgi:hypothetical protein